ncbi:MAG TPA: hypothetical protein VGK22_14310 [Candidatus Angelobacter sp.]|jgi:hypothetical protein
MSKEEIIDAVKKCAAELGHAPSQPEFKKRTKISKYDIRKNFGTYTQMMAVSEVQRGGSGCVVELKSLFLDWAGIVRKLGKVPTIAIYEQASRYSVRPMIRRFSAWSLVPTSMMEYAKREGLESEWDDVLMIIVQHLKGEKRKAQIFGPTGRMTARPNLMRDRPIFGQPMHAPLCCAPTNENGVVFAFGTVARDLGFSILRVQIECPDCTALRHMGNNQWQVARIEFEYESRNFLTHMHSPAAVDLIVCWRHNWEECPLEVIELQSLREIWKSYTATPETEEQPGLGEAEKNKILETVTMAAASQHGADIGLEAHGLPNPAAVL